MLREKVLDVSRRVLMLAINRHVWKWTLRCAVDAQLEAGLASAHLQPVVNRDCEHHKLPLCSRTVQIHGPIVVLAGLRDVLAQAYRVSCWVKLASLIMLASLIVTSDLQALR
eukprot:1338926-Pleurochrysis_carterae.AAC.4